MRLAPFSGLVALSVWLLAALPAWGSAGEAGVERQVGAGPGEQAASPPAVPSALSAARALVDAGRFEEALGVLLPLLEGRPDHPRRTDVLFLAGLAAMEASLSPGIADERRGRLLDLAIGWFRLILIDRPELVRVRLELARAFFLKGEDGLSQRHFELVLAGEPPAAVAANVRRFLNEIRARRRWELHLGAAIAPDSNVGGTSDEEIIYIYGLPFRRDAQDLAASGVGLSVWGGGEYQHPVGERLRLRAGADVLRREHGGSAFDETFASLRLGPRVLVDERTELSVLALASQRWAGTVKDFHAPGVRLEAVRRMSRSVTVRGRVSWEERRYRTRRHLDGPAADISVAAAWAVWPTVRAELSGGYGRERPEHARERHERYRVGAGVSFVLPLGFTMGGGGEYRWAEYEAGWFPHVPDGGARRDRTWSARASVHNRGITLHGFSPEVAVVHEVRETNAQLYGYERTRGELRLVRQF